MTLLDEIRKGEGEKMEFKTELPEDSMRYVDTIISYSNGAGGKLIIGVNDQRNITGLSWEEMNDIESRVTSAVTDLCTPQIVPHFHRWNLEGKNVLEIRVHEGDKRPYHIKGKKWETTFIRVGSANRQSSEATVREMELRTSGRSFDGFRSEEEDLDEYEIKRLCEDLSEYKKREFTRKDLVNLRVIRKDADGEYPTIAYSLLVGSNHPSYVTECASFKGNTKSIFLDKETIDGPVHKQIDKALSFVLRHTNVGIRLQKRSIANEDIFEVPKDAIRESIANALAHRNYIQIEGRTMVAVFDDRIEVTSQGTLPPGLT
ncbi:MAG: putative DNA binding domain-containing protein, partial [Methanomassiliicoccaceae archaeon]|nr:putative DNA binding domain-containing protein [Methanomassiliicoccaceae archaeon]